MSHNNGPVPNPLNSGMTLLRTGHAPELMRPVISRSQDFPGIIHSEPLPLLQSASEQAARLYTVILVSGEEDGGKRATLAFTMACTALSMDLDAHLFLVGDGSIWAYEGNAERARLNGFPPLHELMGDFQDLGGSISVCSTCDRVMCGLSGDVAAHDVKPVRRIPGIEAQGMATLLARVMEGRAVTF